MHKELSIIVKNETRNLPRCRVNSFHFKFTFNFLYIIIIIPTGPLNNLYNFQVCARARVCMCARVYVRACVCARVCICARAYMHETHVVHETHVAKHITMCIVCRRNTSRNTCVLCTTRNSIICVKARALCVFVVQC